MLDIDICYDVEKIEVGEGLMEFNFFGNKFELSIKKQEDIEEIKKGNIYDRYNFKISIFLLTFMFFFCPFYILQK